VVAAARELRGRLHAARQKGEHIDDVRAVRVDQHRRTLVLEGVRPAADQPIALGREIRHHRGDIRTPGEPGLHRVPVGGDHLRQLPGLERTQVGGDQLLGERREEQWREHHHRDARRERRARTRERAEPERPAAPRRAWGAGTLPGGGLRVQHARQRRA
jgi:hypothetical protein